MKFELNLDNKKEAEKQVKLIQKSIDDLLEVPNSQKQQLLENIEKMEGFESHIKTLQNANSDLIAALKSIHIILGNRKELFVEDEEMQKTMNELAKFILSPSVIKAGVKVK